MHQPGHFLILQAGVVDENGVPDRFLHLVDGIWIRPFLRNVIILRQAGQADAARRGPGYQFLIRKRRVDLHQKMQSGIGLMDADFFRKGILGDSP